MHRDSVADEERMEQQEEDEHRECEPAVDIECSLLVPDDRDHRENGTDERGEDDSNRDQRQQNTLSHRDPGDDHGSQQQDARRE